MTTTTAPKTKRFKVVAISSNAQSFGHSGHIMVAEDGTAVEGGRQRQEMNPTIPNLNKGDILEFQVDAEGFPSNWHAHRFETINPFKDGKAPAAIVKEVWGH